MHALLSRGRADESSRCCRTLNNLLCSVADRNVPAKNPRTIRFLLSAQVGYVPLRVNTLRGQNIRTRTIVPRQSTKTSLILTSPHALKYRRHDIYHPHR